MPWIFFVFSFFLLKVAELSQETQVRQTLPLPRTVPVEDEASPHKRLRWQRAQLGVQG